MLSTLAIRSFGKHANVKPRVTQLLIDGKFVNSEIAAFAPPK